MGVLGGLAAQTLRQALLLDSGKVMRCLMNREPGMARKLPQARQLY